ncbi:hypothetical protein HanHA300_Chr07g0251711 [Helianthus annuus]|nr:hypothetical protein HanHA300_Chr07g0251711 [Helianthus annuus]
MMGQVTSESYNPYTSLTLRVNFMVIKEKSGGYKVEGLFVTNQNLVTTTPRVVKSLGRHPLVDWQPQEGSDMTFQSKYTSLHV